MKHCLNCMEMISDELTVCPNCGYDSETTVERLDQLKPGSMLKDRFLIGNPLGRGGFGITYIAWDTSLARKVAIKEYLPRGLALRESGNTTVAYDEETEEAFLRGVDKTIEESRKLAGFSDLESVVNVHDCFKENGTAYIVMEVLYGENAKEKIKREGKISFDETLKIMTPVLKTLAAVHKTGIIHRDISPDNIFLCDNGKVKLLDFGSARIADSADEKSRSIVLKHGYAPKEQYTSKGRQGPFTDIYSVCATIYKMLTGITPVESLERIADEDELQDISEIVKIPSGAAKAIMQGMAVNASDRIQSADELLERLSAKEKEKNSAFYDAEETVTLYVPGLKADTVSDAPVMADEIKPVAPAQPAAPAKPAVSAPAKTVSAPPAAKPQASEPKEPKPSAQSQGGSGIGKKAGIAAACVVLAAAGIIAIPKLVNKQKAESPVETGITEEDISETASKISTTVAELISDITSTEKEKTTEKTTEVKTEKETVLDLSSLPSGYIKTKDADSKVNLRESPDTSSKSLASLASGTEVKIIEKSGDWYKVAANGKTGYIKSDYISNKKAVPFSTGYVKDGVYYNEWADLKFNIPNGWNNTNSSSDLADFLKVTGFDSCYLFEESGIYSDNENIAFCFYKDTTVSKVASNIEEEPHYSKKELAEKEFYVTNSSSEDLLRNHYVRSFYRQIGDDVILIRIYTYSTEHLDNYQNMISKL